MCATWIAEAIDEIPRDIIIRSFIHCGLTAPSDYPDMAFPENCAKMEPEELFADRPEVLRAYITGGDMEDEDIHTLPAHAARKGLIQYITLDDHERPPSP